MPIDEQGYNLSRPEVISTEINIGLNAPVRVLHASDTHLTRVDEGDSERKRELAAMRAPGFIYAEENLALTRDYALREGLTVLHTGDLIDFVSCGNLKAARALCDECDVFLAAGNHEYSQYVGEALENEAYREQSLPTVQLAFNNDIRFAKREIGGVNFVALDNSYYKIDRPQLDSLKAAVAEGKPVVLLVHNPFFTERLYLRMVGPERRREAYLTCVPHDRMGYYAEKSYIQQVSDDVTDEAYEYIKSEKGIKCILAGHLHFSYEDPITDTLTQYVTGMNILRDITFT